MRHGLAREARRRPDMELLVGPLEAATDAPEESADPVDLTSFDADATEARPTWREDG